MDLFSSDKLLGVVKIKAYDEYAASVDYESETLDKEQIDSEIMENDKF